MWLILGIVWVAAMLLAWGLCRAAARPVPTRRGR
jgi:hypothetical protein